MMIEQRQTQLDGAGDFIGHTWTFLDRKQRSASNRRRPTVGIRSNQRPVRFQRSPNVAQTALQTPFLQLGHPPTSATYQAVDFSRIQSNRRFPDVRLFVNASQRFQRLVQFVRQAMAVNRSRRTKQRGRFRCPSVNGPTFVESTFRRQRRSGSSFYRAIARAIAEISFRSVTTRRRQLRDWNRSRAWSIRSQFRRLRLDVFFQMLRMQIVVRSRWQASSGHSHERDAALGVGVAVAAAAALSRRLDLGANVPNGFRNRLDLLRKT